MENTILGEDLPLPPARLFERLASVPGYTWDQSFPPFHSTYDHWHVLGILHNPDVDTPSNASSSVLTSRSGRSGSARGSPKIDHRPSLRHSHWSSISGTSESSDISSSKGDPESVWMPVVARISTHILQLEREYNQSKQVIQQHDPECRNTIRPIDIFRLPTTAGDVHSMIVCVYEAPGYNVLRDIVDFGPAFYGIHTYRRNSEAQSQQIDLACFLDFAIGACECLELLHHGAKAVHGEIRQDTFHWNKDKSKVRMMHWGNGPRSFENLLSSEGWATLSKELGVKNKLQFIAPEQTGRLPADPDSRTDIYSLGILLWILLTKQPAFDADTPIDIVQKVLSSRLPLVSSIRLDVPDVISHIIAKTTQKQMDARYHSISGLKYDLVQIQKALGEGDQEKIKTYRIGQHDVSSFFILPSRQIGRHLEHERLIKIIDKVVKRQSHASPRTGPNTHQLLSNASNSSISEGIDTELADSDSSSSYSLRESRSNSTTVGLENAPLTTPGTAREARTYQLIGRGIADHRTHSIDLSDRDSTFSGGYLQQSDAIGPMFRGRHGHKYRAKGKTEVISVLGAQGIGKSMLVRSVQPHVRKHGYFAMARFDRARPTPFEPLIKLMSSLFRQIFSERDVASPYHEHLRSHVRPLWNVLHNVLDLPETLLDLAAPSKKIMLNTAGSDVGTPSIRTEAPSELRSSAPSTAAGSISRDANDFLRGPASTKSIRFMHSFVDVLRLMCAGKVICLSLDDFQAADNESLELLLHIIKTKIPIILLLASRTDQDGPSPPARKVLDLDSSQKIELTNLKEKHTFEYVAETMSQSIETILPLAAVVYEKTHGNPYFMREILQLCYDRHCLWYDYKSSGWQFNLDKLFAELSSADSPGSLDFSFITKKMAELPAAPRSILAWASLIGSTFSYRLIQEILTGQYFYSSGRDQGHDMTCPKTFKKLNLTESECIDGLQILMNHFFIAPGESDDEFRFTHSRVLNAANAMRECQQTTKMHFIITQAMMSYLSGCRYNLYPLARHICLCADIIKDRMSTRCRYRDVLWRGAQKAMESGAKSTALWYYQTSIQLLQSDPWKADEVDVGYDETLQLFVNTAEILYALKEDDQCLTLLEETFTHARCNADKTRSYILQGRLYSRRGQYDVAFKVLRECLSGMGLELPKRDWTELDVAFKKLEYNFRNLDQNALVRRPLSEDKNDIALGTVLSELLGAAYWFDTKMWFQVVIAFVDMIIDRGNVVQAGLAFTMLAAASFGRFKDFELGNLFGDAAEDYFTLYEDSWTRGRGWTLYSLFVGPFRTPIRNLLPVLENALEYSMASEDRFLSILNLGAMAVTRLYSGQDLAEIEAFCSYGPEEFPDWELDMRGGSILLAARQSARALQGKTGIYSVETMLDDASFKRVEWYETVEKHASNANRPKDMFDAITLGVYLLYDYTDYVIQVGRRLISTTLDEQFSSRPVAAVRYYLCMALCCEAWELPNQADREPLIEEARACKRWLDVWCTAYDVNYLAWSHLMAASIACAARDYKNIINNVEIAIDHCQVHGFALEEALALEMQAEFLLERGAKRPAKTMVQEAMAAYNRISAVGKAKQLADRHEWLLKTATTSRNVDMSVQTMDVTEFVTDSSGQPNKHENTRKWVDPKQVNGAPQDVTGLGLDILDLTSILEFSRIISSELQVDSLLSKMLSVILESVGGQADFCAIVIDSEEQGWCVAGSADHETGVKTYPDGIPFTDVDDQAVQQITPYVLRTKETVFLQNVLEDERFSNVGDDWLSRNPNGRSIINIPILQADHLMGVIHLEGRPHAFTQRSQVVLNLLTNQVAISLGNALLYRKVRKVSASNASMVESQKRALVAAREAEAKAKKAEAEAMHNVRLKEEAAKAKSIFLANVSHELRTPLNGVIGMSELLKGTPLSKDQEGYADSIRVCADTLLTVINDILDFSKLEAGKMQMFTVPLNLKETITEVVRALAYTNKEHGLETIEDLQVDDNLVLGDPVRLHQIFMNLLSNAYKFTPSGSVTVRARKVAETSQKVKITCAVIDTGIGITEEQLTRLFQPFSQADSSTARSYGGSGLGLSICKAMIENVLGGKIWIESTPGQGTTVSFTLAFRKAPKDSAIPDMKIAAKDPDPMANWSQAASPSTAEEKKQLELAHVDLSRIPKEEIRVCIAEDNAINRKIAISFVGKIGLKCEAFEDGKLAYEALQRKSKEGDPFHLVLMDVQMPVLDGYEATKAIRKDPDPNVNKVLIIAMTASAIRGDREKCLEAGMNDYLAKPVRQNVLKSMLDEYMANTHAAREAAKDGGRTDRLTPGDKAMGTVPEPVKPSANGSSTSTTANGHAKRDSQDGQKAVKGIEAASPTSRRPIKKHRDHSHLSETTNVDGTSEAVNGGPPSGKRETDELGKISTERVEDKTMPIDVKRKEDLILGKQENGAKDDEGKSMRNDSTSQDALQQTLSQLQVNGNGHEGSPEDDLSAVHSTG